MVSPPDRIPLPVMPLPAARGSLPLVAILAPLGLALVLWATTSSPYALLVGALGPIMALGSAWEGRRAARRARRDALVSAREALVALEADVAARLAARASELRARAPRIDALDPDATRWWVGTGAVDSGIRLEGEAPAELADQIERLRAASSVVPDVPVVIPGGEELRLVGIDPLVRALARVLVLQAVARCPVGTAHVTTPPGEGWAEALPASREPGPEWIVASAGRRVLHVRVSAGDDATGVDMAVTAAGVRLDGTPETWRPALLAAVEAHAAAARLARAASSAGWRSASELPSELALGPLLAAALEEAPDAPASAACLGVDATGPVFVDLEERGPHALVAGTTGSGKSELLVTWVVALAARRPPTELTFLLVDFKGGASFEPLRALPHVVGVVTDLDETTASRAVQSLRAELRRREAVLAERAARDVAELPAGVLPRLVVVVDEFAALLAADGELHQVFADIAARGRSLGMHLVLGTQRPAGVVRDALLANVTVRVCLRVLDVAESTATVGVPDAASIAAVARGRALLADGERPRVVQLARADPAFVAEVAGRWAGTPPPVARPWLDPLPARLRAAEVPAGAAGLIDRPELQRRDALVFDPWAHGGVLVLGGAASGRTTALAALAAAADAETRWVAGEPVALWDALTAPARGRLLVVLDDLDAALAQGDAEQRADLAELVLRAARDGRREGVALAASARTTGGPMLGVAAAFEQRVLLRLPSREEHLLAGGDARSYRAERRPGAALWNGHEAQFATTPAPRPWLAPTPGVRLLDGLWGLVTPRPGRWIARLEAAGIPAAPLDGAGVDARAVLVADAESWLADHAALSRVRQEGALLLHGCSRADHRMLTRSRVPIPPLAGADDAWLVEHGETRRVRILGGADGR